MLINNQISAVQKICDALFDGDTDRASALARDEYPFLSQPATRRSYTELKCTRIFIRDGCLDRYSGQPLVFPAALRMLSRLLPSEFPFHPNWKMSESHSAYWELFPTLDHIIPVARGGTDDETNLVCTSALRNSAKANWTLKELGWTLLPPGDYTQWDGLIGWFTKYIERYPAHLQDAYIKRWHDAALRAKFARNAGDPE